MALPDFSMRQLLEAGVHFGHQTHRWNPKMSSYIFGERNNIHIIDLAQSVPLLHQALKVVSDTVANGGRVLLVGTKRQAQTYVADSARRSAQYFVNARWLGGMLTNWKTISNSIQRLRKLEELLDGDASGLTKKERLRLDRERDKLERNLGGIKDMGGIPDLLFVIDTNREAIAIQEAKRLGIPVAAIVDSNSDPEGIEYPVPGNDDAGRAIQFYCDLIARAALDGISRGQGDIGVDVGASENPIEEVIAEEAAPMANGAAATAEPEASPAPQEAEPAVEETADAEAETTDAEAETAEAESGDDATEITPLFTAPDGDADDLKKISGVGPALEGKLNALGITRFSQIAAFTPEDIEKVDAVLNFKGRIERDNWIQQAADFSAEA
ncbi:MAG: 30S ribosomal protein S2 [Pseudomonadota bacterium]